MRLEVCQERNSKMAPVAPPENEQAGVIGGCKGNGRKEGLPEHETRPHMIYHPKSSVVCQESVVGLPNQPRQPLSQWSVIEG